MWTSNIFRKNRTVWAYIVLAKCSNDVKFNLKRVLVLSKRTRYELEKLLKPGITDAQMEKVLRKRGSDYDTLIRHHNLHKDFHNRLIYALSQNGLDVKTVNMTEYTEEAINWADLIVPTGGDGTFLLAASKIKDRDKPIVGFNSDPNRSEGYLCLPKPYSYHLSKSVEKIVKNEFSWLFRSRIQIKLSGPKSIEDSVQHEVCRPYSYTRVEIEDADAGERFLVSPTRILPYLALNEVFVGESVSSQVSYMDVEIPGYVRTTVKCSGLCVCTGTGSTSWHLSINRLSRNKVQRLLEIAGLKKNPQEIEAITKKFNDSLKFPPDDPRLFYTLRDLIRAGVLPNPPGLPSDNYIDKITVASRCYAANLVIDGGRCYSFNDGASAELYTKPENALRSITLN